MITSRFGALWFWRREHAQPTRYTEKAKAERVEHREDGGVMAREETAAAAFLREHEAEWGDYDEEEAKRVLRKLDFVLIPLIMVCVTLATVDSLISNASLYGMNEDTHLKGQEYNWIGSIFNIGWLLAEYPGNALMQKLPVGKTISVSVFLWGATVMCLAAAQNAAALMVLRFLMGVFEAILYPGIAILISMWYKKAEQPARVAWSFVTFVSILSGLLSYGVGRAHTGIANWRLLFLIVGSLTIVWSVVLMVWLPDSPTSSSFFKGKEKYIALDRIKLNMTGVDNKKFKWHQVREAFTDYKTYILFLIFFCLGLPGGAIVAFSAQIVSGFGYGRLETVLLGMPTSIFQDMAALAVALPQQRLRNKRCLAAGLCLLIPIVSTTMLRILPNDQIIGKLVSYYFFFFAFGAYPAGIALGISNVSGHTKKLTVNATIFFAYGIACVIGPQLFFPHEAPRYATGFTVIIVALVVCMLCLAAFAVGCMVENKMRDEREGVKVEISVDDALDDLTDYEKKGFRYVY